MKYTKELYDDLRMSLGMGEKSPLTIEVAMAFIDEIDRLQAYAMRLLSDETRTWHCPKCGHEWFSNALVGKTYAVCPECETPMRPKAELMQEEIDRLTAELEKYRWIPVSDGGLKTNTEYSITVKDRWGDEFTTTAIYKIDGEPYEKDAQQGVIWRESWSHDDMTNENITHYRKIDLPEPPKEEA